MPVIDSDPNGLEAVETASRDEIAALERVLAGKARRVVDRRAPFATAPS